MHAVAVLYDKPSASFPVVISVVLCKQFEAFDGLLSGYVGYLLHYGSAVVFRNDMYICILLNFYLVKHDKVIAISSNGRSDGCYSDNNGDNPHRNLFCSHYRVLFDVELAGIIRFFLVSYMKRQSCLSAKLNKRRK